MRHFVLFCHKKPILNHPYKKTYKAATGKSKKFSRHNLYRHYFLRKTEISVDTLNAVESCVECSVECDLVELDIAGMKLVDSDLDSLVVKRLLL